MLDPSEPLPRVRKSALRAVSGNRQAGRDGLAGSQDRSWVLRLQLSTAKYLKIHGEQAAFTLHFGQGADISQAVIDIIQQTDYEQFKKEKRKQKLKSQQRGRTTTTKRNLTKTLEEIVQSWGKVNDSS